MVTPFSFPGLRVTEVSDRQIYQAGGRLDAGSYFCGIGSTQLWPTLPLAGAGGLTKSGHKPRFKRPYVDFDGLPFYQPSQICEINPEPARLLAKSSASQMAPLCVKKGQILLTCSGTVGDASIVGKTLDGAVFSHDLIRMDTHESSPVGSGYIYAFLKTKRGKQAVVSHSYGAVIKHIEPEHLADVEVPIAEASIVESINEAILKSFKLRDDSNELMVSARKKLLNVLDLPPIDDLRKKRAGELTNGFDVFCFEVTLDDRIDASRYNPIATTIELLLSKHTKEVTTVGAARVSKKIILPGQFKRIYVEEGYGVPFFSGKDIGELNPTDKKYISSDCHADRIDELTIHENMVLLTCSGTVGNANIVPKHWDGWTMTHDIIRVIATDKWMAGYLYAWLSCDYGRTLVKSYAYGAVVQHIEDHHLAEVVLPILDESFMKEIGSLVLEANEKRYQAFLLEEHAMNDFNTKVWGA
ncbi:hypothetical protein ACIGCM_06185 [Pseudomonas sp. NPDC078700]|uniref:hypothetical protein n=1 Tax=Pseudomonas sp. NPDC078700 TaxID=3364424 RepID=UPI0037C75166